MAAVEWAAKVIGGALRRMMAADCVGQSYRPGLIMQIHKCEQRGRRVNSVAEPV